MLTAEILIPASLRDSANQLAAAIGLSLDDLLTFRNSTHEDAEGNQYCLVGVQVSETWPATVAALLANPEALPRPAFDVDEVIDMDAAREVLAGATILDAPSETTLPAPTGIVMSLSGLTTAYGLSRIPEE